MYCGSRGRWYEQRLLLRRLGASGSLPAMTTMIESALHAERAQHWAPKLKALADENRLLIALLLSDREHSVRQLQDATGLSQTLVSHHLKLLREHNLVSVRVEGRSNHYSLCCSELQTIIEALSGATTSACR
jgi:DNA-binding transcriptional ArsR family regulator